MGGNAVSGNREQALFSIGEVSRRVSLTAHTIRYYEGIGLLNSVRRADGGRVYGEDDGRRLKFTTRLKLLGITLDEIKELEDLYLRHSSNYKVLSCLSQLLGHHLDTLASRIEQLKILKRDMEAYKHHIEQRL